MEIVVRTPHGDADVSIESRSATTTLGELIATVTGQAVARLVYVDGRALHAATELDRAGLCVGSVVTTDPTATAVHALEDVDIVQVAGHGAGRTMRLGRGRYRIGPGRRAHTGELDLAPVEQVAFEMVVEPTDAASTVTAIPSNPAIEVTLDGAALDGAGERWQDELLTAASRAFRVESPARSGSRGDESAPDDDGTIAFGRPPRRPSVRARRPVVDAVRDAQHRASTLWERRPGQPGAFEFPLGVSVDDGTVVAVHLESTRAMAITGSDGFRRALARTIMVEASTLHGPADVDIVVATDAARLGAWDWAKWLPHLRADGYPNIWSSRHDITRWADGASEAATGAPGGSPPCTLLIVDDPGLWNRRDAPLRAIVSDPPARLRLIALCSDETQAPSACTTVISETGDGFARLQTFERAVEEEVFRPALTESSVAGEVARALAPLVDIELARSPAPTDGGDVGFTELIGVTRADEIIARWTTAAPRSTLAIGRRGHDVVETPVSDDVTIVVGSSMGDAFDVAATSVLAQCVDRPSEDLWVVPVVFDRSPRSELLWQLPHATDPHDQDIAIDPRRLLSRLRTVLSDPGGPSRVVLVAEASTISVMAPDSSLLSELADGVHSIDGLALIVITDRSDAAELVGDTIIRVQHRGGARGVLARRTATLVDVDGTAGRPFSPVQRTAPLRGLEVSVFAIGRPFTALERRVEQRRAEAMSAPDAAAVAFVRSLRDAASQRRPPHGRSEPLVGRTVVPPPMPTAVDLDELFGSSPGDGVPLGLADDPAQAGMRTRWWEPGSGSLLVFGSRRSGMEHVLTTVLVGLLDRFSDLDVRLLVIEPSSARRRALESVDRNVRVVEPDRADQVVEALDDIAAELDRRPRGPAVGGPRLVVLVSDLAQLRRQHDGTVLGDRIDGVLAAAAATGSGVDVIAAVADLDAAGPFASATVNRLVGASSNHADLAALGVERPSELDGIAGRCRAFPDDELVQIAMADVDLQTLLSRRTAGESE